MHITTLAVAIALAATSSVAFAADQAPGTYTDVAYTELSAGNAQTALSKLQAGGAVTSHDPATLINLGSAYVATGQREKALIAYQAAVASPERYDLQLADGSWVDSREAARLAIRQLMKSTAQASR